MKIKNIRNMQSFLSMVDSCSGRVELVTGEGDRLNLKSKLCQYVALDQIFSDKSIAEIEIIAYEAPDNEKLVNYLLNENN